MACTDFSAANFPANMTAPQAQAYYACKYFESVSENALKNLLISGVQQAIATYFADKQYEVAKQAQDRLDTIAADQLAQSQLLRNHWTGHFQPCEAAAVDEVCARPDYVVDYETVKARAEADVERAFAPIYQKIDECYDIHCIGARCAATRQADIEKAKAKTAAVTQAWRKEEARKDIKDAQRSEEKYKYLGLGRGLMTQSLQALQGAQAAAQASSQINPYAGFQGVVGATGQAFRNYFAADERAAAGGMAFSGFGSGFNPSIGNQGYSNQGLITDTYGIYNPSNGYDGFGGPTLGGVGSGFSSGNVGQAYTMVGQGASGIPSDGSAPFDSSSLIWT